MRPPAVALEQAPPGGVTLPFLAVAPWFAVAAGLLLAVMGPRALSSRWSPGALALTHLLTAGFMLQATSGALLQFASVVVGARFWRPRLVARLAQLPMLAGAALLAWALGSGRPALALPAGLVLASGIGVFVLAVGAALWRASGGWRASWPLWAALLGLSVTATLGVLLAAAVGGRIAVPLVALANWHALWGLAGWALVLLMGISAVVVPMLQLTPVFPRWLQRACTALIVAPLCLASLAPDDARRHVLAMALPSVALVAAATYAIGILLLQARTRRPRADASAAYLRIAMLALVGLCVAGLLALSGVARLTTGDAVLVAGIAALVGVFVAAISGMLYKIVPFMLWLGLIRDGGVRGTPTIATILAPERGRRQLALFCAAAIALLLAPLLPGLASIAGLLFAGSSAWLAVDVGRAVWIHRRALRPA
jgi:hypothetical protein